MCKSLFVWDAYFNLAAGYSAPKKIPLPLQPQTFLSKKTSSRSILNLQKWGSGSPPQPRTAAGHGAQDEYGAAIQPLRCSLGQG